MRGGVPRTSVLAGAAGIALAAVGMAAQPQGRVFGYGNIKRHLQRQKRDWGHTGSISGHGHDDHMAMVRRTTQAARNEARQRERAERLGIAVGANLLGEVVVGVSRRGRYVLA